MTKNFGFFYSVEYNGQTKKFLNPSYIKAAMKQAGITDYQIYFTTLQYDTETGEVNFKTEKQNVTIDFYKNL